MLTVPCVRENLICEIRDITRINQPSFEAHRSKMYRLQFVEFRFFYN